MPATALILDIVTMAGALGAAALWYAASGRRLRRVSYRETLDPAGLNRIVVVINRSQMLNARDALAAAIWAPTVTGRLLLDVLKS